MNSSEQFDQLATALAAAQGLMANAVLNKTNPHFKSRYADLAAIRDAVRDPLAQQGIAVMQVVGSDENGSYLATRLVHKSGQWIETLYPLPATAKAQEFGSALTYARRYSLATICGVAAEEDDDANAGNNETVQTVRAPVRTVAPVAKDAKTTTEGWVKNTATPQIRTLSTLQALKDWEGTNGAIIDKLKKQDPTQANILKDVLDECWERLSPNRIAAE